MRPRFEHRVPGAHHTPEARARQSRGARGSTHRALRGERRTGRGAVATSEAAEQNQKEAPTVAHRRRRWYNRTVADRTVDLARYSAALDAFI